MFGKSDKLSEAPPTDHLTEYLQDGWTVEGYTVSMLAAGALHHAVLLRKDHQLVSAQVTKAGDKEIGRRFDVLAPVGIAPTTVVNRR